MNKIDTLLQAAEYIAQHEGESFPIAMGVRFRTSSGPARGAPDADHGYASSLPVALTVSQHQDDLRAALKRNKNKKSLGSRTTHNELEKNRRAHLRTCLEKLKDMVPLGPEASKHTTLGLLTKAKKFIKSLEEKEKRNAVFKDHLAREQRYLQRRLGQLESRVFGSEQQRRRLVHTEGRRIQRPRTDHHQEYSPTNVVVMTTYHHQDESHQFELDHLATMAPRRSLSECSFASVSSGTASRSDLPDNEPASISESDEVDVIGYTSNQSDTDDHSSIQSGSGDSGVALSASRLSLAHMEI